MTATPVLAELLGSDGVREVCELRDAHIGFLALHGGLEATTFEIAAAAADAIGASLYAVVQPPDLRWHVPSHRYARTDSRALDAFCDHVQLAVSIHGYGGIRESDNRWTTAVLGGSNRAAAQRLAARLRGALPDYEWIAELDDIPTAYRGLHPSNPVNCTRAGGVQIELPPRVRGNSPVWSDAPRDARGFVAHTSTLVATLAAAVDAIDPGAAV